jgi:small nuclear ribonucleoprotein (snRNP)-like protein
MSSTLTLCQQILKQFSTADVLIILPEFAGTLLGFDDYVNMVLEDVIEL